MAEKQDFFVGTYSQELAGMAGNGEGIYRCSLDLESGALGAPECVAECVNPSYMAWGNGKTHLYATRETFADQNPALLAFEVCASGGLKLLNERPVNGELPCHLCVDPRGRYLASAQYGSGNVLLFDLEADGRIGAQRENIQHYGSGLNPQRQEGPHAHFAIFLSSPSALMVVDLGLDSIFTYPFNVTNGRLDAGIVVKTELPAGVGPRHMALLEKKDRVFVYCELSEQIFLFQRKNSEWKEVQTVQAFDDLQGIEGAGAAIKMSPDERFLYVSGRNQSEIACFSVDQDDGKLTAVQRLETGGQGPRDFSLSPDGKFVVVANQTSNTLTSFHRDQQSGCLSPTGHEVNLGSPACILF